MTGISRENTLASSCTGMRIAMMLGCLASVLAAIGSAAGDEPTTITLDGSRLLSAFEGLGALSAGASSRLLIDYPEPQRSQILDYLFKPNYGAAFQHFKVEIGGDVNSTDGCEPSHMHARDDENYTRGYEWWLMKEAKARNPRIMLDCLEWGAPAWIGGGKFYSQDNADYIARFIQGAKRVHGLEIDCTGIWNEKPYDVAWIKLLRKTLDRNGLQHVQIVAADANQKQWAIAADMEKDPELERAVGVIGEHYPRFKTTPTAQQRGKPLWASEDGPWNGNWNGARQLAKAYNRNYVVGRMTKTVVWSLITAYYDNLPLPGSGVMRANTPWCGAYEVQPALWATAHTTQFAQPGWKYLGGEGCGLLPAGGSYVTLRAPGGDDFSIIVETMDARGPQAVVFRLAGGLRARKLHVWRSDVREQFVRIDDAAPAGEAVMLTLEPESIYSLTTTTGQQKGLPATPIPARMPFPNPYEETFESYQSGTTPRYFDDQAGIFEVALRADGRGQCLRQIVDRKGIEWQPMPEPWTLLGDALWGDGEVSVDARIEPLPGRAPAGEAPGARRFVALLARVGRIAQNAAPPAAYCLRLYEDGDWELRAARSVLASGKVASAGDAWHALAMRLQGTRIVASIDGKAVAERSDEHYELGRVGLGSGWHGAQFANFRVKMAAGKPKP
jgi:galactosylceramidase